MATSGAQPGNRNAAKGRLWHDAIKRAVARKANGDLNHGLDLLAEKLIEAVITGDVPALKEFGDRMDGKAHQSVDLDATVEGGAGLLGVLAEMGKPK